MSTAALCNESATVQRKTTAAPSVTNGGSLVSTFPADASPIFVMRPQPASGRTREEAMRRNIQVSHTFYCPTDPVLGVGDRLLYGGLYYQHSWTSDEGGRGRVWAIHALLKTS